MRLDAAYRPFRLPSRLRLPAGCIRSLRHTRRASAATPFRGCEIDSCCAVVAFLVAARLRKGPKNRLRDSRGPLPFLTTVPRPLGRSLHSETGWPRFASAGGALPPPGTGRWGGLNRLGPIFPGGSPNPPLALRGAAPGRLAPAHGPLNGVLAVPRLVREVRFLLK